MADGFASTLAPRLAVACAAVLLLGSSPVDAAAKTENQRFVRFQTAWQGSDAAGLVSCIDAKSKVTVLLLEKPFSGRAGGYAKDRAAESLKRYFAAIHSPKLKDVTPADQLKKNPSVRIYDYTYRPKKGNRLTTRLEVRIKKNAKKLWVLDSVSERRKS